jgi:hypothetical protein
LAAGHYNPDLEVYPGFQKVWCPFGQGITLLQIKWSCVHMHQKAMH